jgi:hypothetical protein
LPIIPVIAYSYSMTWSRETAKTNAVFGISELYGEVIR